MTLLYYIISILWAGRIVANIVSFAALWFVKEYRFDRMLIHFHTSQGKRLYFLPFRRPPVTIKSFCVIVGSFIVLGMFFLVLPSSIFVRLFLVDVLSFPATLLLVFFMKMPTYVYHEYQIFRAVRKLRHHKPMLVIGITGSYGKTTIKEYIAEILLTKYRVLKTDASKNSPIGIAETIHRKLTPEHEIFVVEMGAYKRGEIARMTAMVQPQIGIITAINPQHQDLFGSIETTMKAKYELVEGLSGKQIAIVNSDNFHVRDMAQWAKRDRKTVWSFSAKQQTCTLSSKHFWASDVVSHLTSLSLTIHEGNLKEKVTLGLPGTHQATNILAAIAGAVAAGMTFKDVAQAARFIKPHDKTLNVMPGINGSLYIDDTFNNNPDAAIAALDVLAQTKGRKILVFQPMIELGKYTDSSHQKVGAHAGAICDDIILTNNNFLDSFEKGVKSTDSAKIVSVLSPGKAADFIRKKLTKGTAVLFKGKEAEHILKRL